MLERSLALQACLALRDGRTEQVGKYFVALLGTDDASSLLHGVQDVLLLAVRKQQPELFCDLLVQADSVLLPLLQREDAALGKETGSFLRSLAFVVCDRRLVQLQPLLRRQLKTFLRSASEEEASSLWSELLNLCARMTRRGWRDEASWLLRLLIWSLLRQKKPEAWQRALLQLQMHFVVYARWDGFSGACKAYAELVQLLLLTLKRAQSPRLAQNVREQYLLLALRFVRDTVANVSRARMEDDMDVFLQWHAFLLEVAGEDEARRVKLLQLLQLAIGYWQSTRPRTSRKQLRYLGKLLQPDLLDAQLRTMLEKIG